MVDKDLFLYNLAVVAIMKNEEPYVKEWLDYHLLAGVDHFYIYDNDSTAEFKKILQPYIDAGIVTYIFFGGKCRQYESYTNAVKRFRFYSRYVAVIDGDEFIFPKSKSTITEVVDDVLSQNLNASGLAVNWQIFGSNGMEKADYSCGVLERFVRRAETDYIFAPPDTLGGMHANDRVKQIFNPRHVNFMGEAHAATYFIGKYAINSLGKLAPYSISYPITADHIVINHYHTKSREEYYQKVQRGNADAMNNGYVESNFEIRDRNEVFDDGILMYQKARYNALIPNVGGGYRETISLKTN